ncbi:cation:proton antiporter [Thermodesulfobacteriota bacterium]
MHTAEVLLDLFLIFTAAKVLGWAAVRVRQPEVIGELLAGVIIGPHLLGLIHPNETIMALSELGLIILLFSAGLETEIEDLQEVGKNAIAAAVLGVIFPLGLGFLVMYLLGYSTIESWFVAVSFMATSVGISARVLGDMGLIKHKVARIVLGAAILDDILSLIALAIVTAAAKGAFEPLQFILLVLEAGGFVWFLATFGNRWAQVNFPVVTRFGKPGTPFIVALIICLGLSLMAEYIGLAAIVGAFMAGMVLSGVENRQEVEKRVKPLGIFMTPFFFVMMGAHVDLKALANPALLAVILAVVVVAVVSKLVGAGLGAYGMGWKNMVRTGLCMVPRGEVGIVVASIGLTLGTIKEEMYTVVVSMSILTTIVAPPLIRILFKGSD